MVPTVLGIASRDGRGNNELNMEGHTIESDLEERYRVAPLSLP